MGCRDSKKWRDLGGFNGVGRVPLAEERWLCAGQWIMMAAGFCYCSGYEQTSTRESKEDGRDMEMGSDLNEMSARIGIAARFPEEQGAAWPIYAGGKMTCSSRLDQLPVCFELCSFHHLIICD